MTDAKYQAGTYQVNPAVVGYQAPPPVMAMAVAQPQETFKAFDTKKAKVSSIALIVLGSITAILTLFILSFFGVFAFPIPIFAGVLGLLASKKPQNWKIVSFMVLSIISAIISIIMAIVCLSAIFGGAVLTQEENAGSLGTTILITGILGAIFYVALAIVSIYSSVVASKQVGCCGCCDQNQHFQGVVHGKVQQPVSHVENLPPGGQYTVGHVENLPPGGQYMQFQNPPPHPPPYNQVIQQA